DNFDVSGPSIDGGDGNDFIRIRPDFSGITQANSYDATVTGGAGNDTITATSYSNSYTRDLTLDGGTGNDSISGSGRTNGATEILIGGDGNDTLRGSSGDDLLQGGADNDSLFGGSQNDTLEGGAGDDTLEGEAGDDTIDGGTESSSDGDVVVFNGARGNYSIIGNAT
ncbi:MAG: calcium-binding protein, partial [Pseudomonadota bacterium]